MKNSWTGCSPRHVTASDGPALARRRPLRRIPRIRQRQAAAERLALSRLRDSRAQRRQAVRAICPGADRRRRDVPGRSAGVGGDSASFPPARGISSVSRSCAKGRSTRTRRECWIATTWWHHRVHVQQHDRALRPVPRPQVRSDSAGRLLQPAGGVCRHRSRRPPFDDDPALNARRQELLRRKQAIQIRLQPLLDKVEFATSPEIVELDNSIQDASLLLAHMGEPKTPRDAEEKSAWKRGGKRI